MKSKSGFVFRFSQIVAAAVVIFALVACEEPHIHKFSRGDCVQMRIDGRRGMVVRTFEYQDLLSVRFPGVSITTDTGWAGGGPVQVGAYALEYVREFEVEGCK